MATDKIFIAAAYLDLAEADADFEMLRRLYDNAVSTDAFDCVTIGRRSSGEVRLHREPGHDHPSARSGGPTRSLAGGLALALFPSIGGDIPASQVLQRETLGAVAGVVAGALGRTDLHEFGDVLDHVSAGLITAMTPTCRGRVGSALTNAQASLSRLVSVDLDAVERSARLIAARHRPRDPD